MILIKTPFNGLIGDFDLLLAMQYFIKSIADVLDVDLSKPDYSEELTVDEMIKAICVVSANDCDVQFRH